MEEPLKNGVRGEKLVRKRYNMELFVDVTPRGYGILIKENTIFMFSRKIVFSFDKMKERYHINDEFIRELKKRYRQVLCYKHNSALEFKYQYGADEFLEEVIMPLETIYLITENAK